MSCRRFMSYLRDAFAKGLVIQPPSFTTIFRCLEAPELTPILKDIIVQSSIPLGAVETDFAADSSGFSTSVFARWLDERKGKPCAEHTWVKAHVSCGVLTHVVTAAEVTPFESADGIMFPGLVKTTAENFKVEEYSADKAYSDRRNLLAVKAVGGTAYIPFKSSTTGLGGHHHRYDGLWDEAYHYYNLHRSEFLARYHKRSNVETTFDMIKAKFGHSVRAKTPTAQVNEVLCKIVCHNICVLIQSIYESGLEPVFWGGN